jgi:Fe-S-cluster-containing hydrogenase component 2
MDRRTFLKTLAAAGVAATGAGAAFMLPGTNLMVMPNSKGYLVVDMGKCMGCDTCMMTCSLVHHGEASLSLSRIQIQQDAFQSWPNDIHMAVCHQCEDAPCVNICPVGALRFGEHRIELREEVCIGCKMCIMACPFGAIRPEAEPMPSVDYRFKPSLSKFVETAIGEKTIAIKCDLCEGREGGPACVEVCPTKALMFLTPEEMERRVTNSKAGNAVAGLVKYSKESSESMETSTRIKTSTGS